MTGEQIRAARAIARIGQAELAKLSGLSLETIKRLEGIRGPVDANVRTITAIIDAFARESVALELGEDGRIGVSLVGAAAPRPVVPFAAPGPRAAGTEPAIYRLIYRSQAGAPARANMEANLDKIRRVSARRNAELGVTGMLMTNSGWFLGVLEGDKAAVQQIYGAISADPTHGAPEVLQGRYVPHRQFTGWGVCCGRFTSDDAVFAHDPVMAGGFHPEGLSPAAALGLLTIARDLEAELPRRHCGGWDPCPLASQCLDDICVASVRRRA